MDTRNAVLEVAQEMGFKANTLARSLARKSIKIAVVAFTSFPEFHKSFLQGAHEAHEELMDYNIQVEYFSYEQGDSNLPAGDKYLKELLEGIACGGYDGALICARECEQFKLLKEKQVAVATAINDICQDMRRFGIRYNGWIAGKWRLSFFGGKWTAPNPFWLRRARRILKNGVSIGKLNTASWISLR